MYAVVDIAGQQFQVEEGAVVRVPLLDLEEGVKQTFSDVLLVRSETDTLVGSPHVAGASVEATVVGHGRGDKIIVFKMKRRKNYRRRNGHRQEFTEIKIDGIVAPN
ncbi:MAG TPA: 50S ribosomal protein L21 [Candidatus Latescibacteria bacterium]|jgi:large subunit ribosomal protein L21|nr:50S ribosomal protein L21 [Candidatus Latescibacterota bacterium]|tara:strand:+ start:1176 stop:1493 length:318 start_codon:yes stop_codon:yes gene_type:complete